MLIDYVVVLKLESVYEATKIVIDILVTPSLFFLQGVLILLHSYDELIMTNTTKAHVCGCKFIGGIIYDITPLLDKQVPLEIKH